MRSVLTLSMLLAAAVCGGHNFGRSIHELNADSASAKFGATPFSHMSPDEWRAFPGRHGIVPRDFHAKAASGAVYFTPAEIAVANATPVNWRTAATSPTGRGTLTRIKQQGLCGSCWAFSVLAVMESMVAKATGIVMAFSEQEILDCISAHGLNGCAGGDPMTLAQALINHPTPLEQDYPYTFFDGGNTLSEPCRSNVFAVMKPSQVLYPAALAGQSIEAAAVAYLRNVGPLAVSVDTRDTAWQHYQSGIIDVCPPVTSLSEVDHGVTVVGYGTDSGVPYFILKNSWGPMWGEEGYVRIRRGTNECGVALLMVGLNATRQ